MSTTTVDLKQNTALERVFSLFATVHAEETVTVLLLMVNVFLLLTAYYIIKPVREALILGGPGAEMKSYAGALQALMLLFIIPLYSAFASRTNRIRLINGVIGFFISNLVIFYVLGRMNVQLGVPFFLWTGLFNVMLTAQFWAFANDLYTEQQGKRLFAIVGIGSSVGAIAGADIAGRLFKPIGPYSMMLVSASILAVCMILTNWIHMREGATQHRSEAQKPTGTSGGFRLIVQHKYLLLIAVLVLLENLVNTNGEFILGKTISQQAKGAANASAFIGEFYAGFYFWVNLAGAALQIFLVSRIMKYIGIGPALFILPGIALGSYTLLAFAPVLSIIRMAKIAENSTDYSLQNTARHSLFLNTSRDAKYKAQSAVESFFWRAGDGISALLVFIGTKFGLGISRFAVVNIFFVALWIGAALAIVQLRKRHEAGKVQVLA
jgi:ATP:ADP antiporter, AAA family